MPPGLKLRTPVRASSERCALHPRVCGEHCKAETIGRPQRGSSPRVRGTPPSTPHRSRRVRFIPARAGNTRRGRARPCPPPVHPRACGEHSPASLNACASNGSSPRVRGTRRYQPTLPTAGTVHPRACGEHCACSADDGLLRGSSPRVRGTHSAIGLQVDVGRFIPARAGNTLLRESWIHCIFSKTGRVPPNWQQDAPPKCGQPAKGFKGPDATGIRRFTSHDAVS